MSMSFSSGTTPMPNDTRWVLLVKILMSLNGGGGGVIGGSGAVLQGSGAPVAAPSDPNSPALYTDTTSGTLWYWSVASQTWN
jgi:hypothetical protein